MQHRFGVRATWQAGGLDDQPFGERQLRRGGNDGVDVLLADAAFGVEELPLDRGESAAARGSDEIDPGICSVETTLARPIPSCLDSLEALRLCRIGYEPYGNQLLECGPLVLLADSEGRAGFVQAVKWIIAEFRNPDVLTSGDFLSAFMSPPRRFRLRLRAVRKPCAGRFQGRAPISREAKVSRLEK